VCTSILIQHDTFGQGAIHPMTPFLYGGLTRLTQLWLFGEAIGDARVRWPDPTDPSYLVPNVYSCPAVQVTGIASLQLKKFRPLRSLRTPWVPLPRHAS
jgi:hypothetical protein